MLHYMSVTMREEDLVVLLYFLLTSAYGSLHEFAAYGPEIVVLRRLVGVGRDKEITAERSKQIFLVSSKRSTRSNWVGVTLRVLFSINHLPIHV